MDHKQLFALYIRNFIFGVEDSLVSTVGLLAGVAAGGMEQRGLVLTGIVLLFVEAFSMAVGSFLSEYSTEEYAAGQEVPSHYSLVAGSVMFTSYFVFGFIPLIPYIIFSPIRAFWISIVISLFALALLGVMSGRMFKVSVARTALRMVLIGGAAIGIGVLVSSLIQ
jgi:VIT1/CCC1 family predicted Fe2+/Mn2+ transporter